MGGFVVSRESLLAAMSDEDWERLYSSIGHPHLRKARDERISAMREFITGSLDLLTSDPRLPSMRAPRKALKASVLSNLAELLIDDSGVQEPSILWSRRWKVVTAARELVLSRPESMIGVTEICRAIGVSRRTLQYCFQYILGISPAAFLRFVRLSGARRIGAFGTSATSPATTGRCSASCPRRLSGAFTHRLAAGRPDVGVFSNRKMRLKRSRSGRGLGSTVNGLEQ